MAGTGPVVAVSAGIVAALQQALGATATTALVRVDDLATAAVAPPAVTVLLYRVDMNANARGAGLNRPNLPRPIPAGGLSGGGPGSTPLFLDLRYLVTAHGTTAEEEHDLLDQVLRALHDTPVVAQTQLTVESLALDVLAQLFTALGTPLRPSLALHVSTAA